jgi:hypothetical protein
MGRRSVCDPVDAALIVERITKGETTAADAWRAYAATSVRPYARATFAGALSRARVSAGVTIAVKHERNLKRGVSGHQIRKRAGAPDRSRAQAGPVLVIGPDAALRVRGGALDVEHGSGKDRVHVRIDVDEPKPAAILFDAHGEFLTGEAIRWCARYAIPLILPNGPGRAILFYESALEADGAGEGVNGKHARAGVQVHRAERIRPDGLSANGSERASDRSRDHRRASAGFAVVVGTARGRGAMDGEDDCRRCQTTPTGLRLQSRLPRHRLHAGRKAILRIGSRALSLKAALAGEIMSANEAGVKRAEARPSLRSQFRIGRRRTPVSRRAVLRNNRLRLGHGGANKARARVGRPH